MQLSDSMGRWRFLLLVAAFSVLSLSCSDDDGGIAPSLRSEFVCAHTDASGCVSSVVTDDGEAYAVGQTIRTNVADTVYRCVCTYELDGERNASVYSLSHIYSKFPYPKDSFEKLPDAPLVLQSVWKSGGYVNFILGVLTTGNGEHAYAFCEECVEVDAEGVKTLKVSLLHERPAEDEESYTQDVYLSMPVYGYAGRFDSISVSVPTYQGKKTFVFENYR
jgi:hypothetical protein